MDVYLNFLYISILKIDKNELPGFKNIFERYELILITNKLFLEILFCESSNKKKISFFIRDFTLSCFSLYFSIDF